MTRREIGAGILLGVLLLASALWPSPTKSDQPVVSVVPASEFVAVGTRLVPGVAQSAERRPNRIAGLAEVAGAEPASGARASQQPRTPSPTPPTAASGPPSAPRPVSVAPVVAATGPSGKRDTSMTGLASWYASPIGVSAAGPALRTALGPGWRGVVVQVTANGRQVSTKLGDWMAADRLIDLDVLVFPAVCGPLSLGLCRTEVTW